LAVLQQHHARLTKEDLSRGGGSGLAFPKRGEHALDEANRAKVFHRIPRAAKLPTSGSMTSGPRSPVSCCRPGPPLLYVSQQLDRRKPTTTLRCYAKWITSGDRRSVELLAGNPVVLEPETGTTAVEEAR
jgi:hypothetical protein